MVGSLESRSSLGSRHRLLVQTQTRVFNLPLRRAGLVSSLSLIVRDQPEIDGDINVQRATSVGDHAPFRDRTTIKQRHGGCRIQKK